MDKKLVEDISNAIKLRMERSKKSVPVGVSNKHIHFTEKDFKALFGAGAKPTLYKQLVQPGFYAANEKVDIYGPNGVFKNVRMIGPCRSYTQVEISMGDARILGLKPPIRDSGKLDNTPGIKIAGPKGSIEIKHGVIISKRHIHFSPKDAQEFKIKDGEEARVRCGIAKDRELIFERVLCRVSDKYALEFHVDIEEANAGALENGESVFII
ncbi:MAG: phosphate propanoyltransferase [Elusimicrobia bacterium]|nr:phosphate propanoyltransferase [Elusimicrobiota bacterium]